MHVGTQVARAGLHVVIAPVAREKSDLQDLQETRTNTHESLFMSERERFFYFATSSFSYSLYVGNGSSDIQDSVVAIRTTHPSWCVKN